MDRETTVVELYQNQQIRMVMHKPVATGFQFGIGFALGVAIPGVVVGIMFAAGGAAVLSG